MRGRHGFKFRQSPGNCVHAGAGSYIDQKPPMRRFGVLRSKPGAATSKNWRRDLTINHQNPWQNKHKTDRTLHRIPQGKNRLQKNIVRSHHKRMSAATMLTLTNLCKIYEFDFYWSILKKAFECYAQYSERLQWYVCRIACNCSAEATNITWHCWFLSHILHFKNLYTKCSFVMLSYIKHGRKNSLYFPP